MGAAGRAEVERHFNMAKQVGPFLDILREVAGERLIEQRRAGWSRGPLMYLFGGAVHLHGTTMYPSARRGRFPRPRRHRRHYCRSRPERCIR